MAPHAPLPSTDVEEPIVSGPQLDRVAELIAKPEGGPQVDRVGPAQRVAAYERGNGRQGRGIDEDLVVGGPVGLERGCTAPVRRFRQGTIAALAAQGGMDLGVSQTRGEDALGRREVLANALRPGLFVIALHDDARVGVRQRRPSVMSRDASGPLPRTGVNPGFGRRSDGATCPLANTFVSRARAGAGSPPVS